jgi:anti-anti-sigma regulatory factor
MSTSTAIQTHIAYELIGETDHGVVVIEFLSREIADSFHARQLREQLKSLIRAEFPHNYVLDYGNFRSVGSTAFGHILSFVHSAGQVRVCNVHESVRVGVSLIGLDDCVEFAASRRAAIDAALQAARRGEEETTEYPAFVEIRGE